MTDVDPNDPETYGFDLSKRDFLKIVGATGAVVGGVTGLDSDGETGNLFGGTMALTQAYKVASGERDWYQGPDSAKDAISGQNGDRYSATDTQVEYYWDGGWVLLGIGSSSQAVPAVTTDEVVIADTKIWRIYQDGSGNLFIEDKDDSTDVLKIFDNGTVDILANDLRMQGSHTIQAKGGVNLTGADVTNIGKLRHDVVDVTAISSPAQGYVAYHDGSGSETEGPAFYDGTDWKSIVDGTTITNP